MHHLSFWLVLKPHLPGAVSAEVCVCVCVTEAGVCTHAEAASWEKLGRALHEDAPIGGLGDSPEAVLGTLNALTVRCRCAAKAKCTSTVPPLAHYGGVQWCTNECACCGCAEAAGVLVLQGKGQAGRGVVLDMMCRRVLPCQHP
jgi:hypothetical protein